MVENVLAHLVNTTQKEHFPNLLKTSHISAVASNVDFYMERCREAAVFQLFENQNRKLFKLFTTIPAGK